LFPAVDWYLVWRAAGFFAGGIGHDDQEQVEAQGVGMDAWYV